MTDDVRKLLGGYATGTLTEEERALLYEAALSDPAVFEALAEEQVVRDVLEDAGARAELLAAVQDRPFSVVAALRDWSERAKSRVLVAVAMVLLVAIGVRQVWESRPRTQEVAQVIISPQIVGEGTPQPAPVTLPVSPAKQTPAARKEGERELIASAPAPPPPSIALPQTSGEMPKPVAPAAALPETLSETLADSGAAKVPVLSWSLLRVDARGGVSSVDPDYSFEAADKARIRVETRQSGMLLARAGDEVLYAGSISPELPVVLRRDFTFSNPGTPPAIDLEWASTPQLDAVAAISPPASPGASSGIGKSMGRPRRMTKLSSPEQSSQGVIGGVPSSSRSGFRAGPPAFDAIDTPGRIHLRIQLRRKNP